MSYDDDDAEVSLSSARALERSDHGKAEKREKLQRIKQKQELVKLQRQVLRQQMDKNKQGVFKTETHKEQEESQVQKAGSKPTPDKLVEQSKEQDKADAQRQYEEAQDEPG